MEEILNQLITVGACAGVLGLCYLVCLSSGVIGVHYDKNRTWSWKIFLEDFLKMLIYGASMVGYVLAANLLTWLFSRFGMDVSLLAEGASTVLILKRMLTASLDYLTRANNNYDKFFKERHSDAKELVINPENANYTGIAKDVKDAVSALYSSINTLQENPEAVAGEVIFEESAKTLAEMGAAPYYNLDVSTPQKAYQNLLGKGFNEGYGLQCVAGFKEFMFSLCGRYVAAGGSAKNYAFEPARTAVCGLGFTWHSGAAGLQDGDWGIWINGQHGHVAMYYQGRWLGQNQAAVDGNVGNAFNLLGLPMEGFAGYFRPDLYANLQKIDEKPTESGKTSDNVAADAIQRGDFVEVIKYVDVNGTKLKKLQKTPYTVFQTRKSDNTAVLKSDDGDIYARISIDNIRKVK